MCFEDPVFWKCAYIWKTSEEKVSKNTVRTSMRKTCKNHPKNEQKTHQKSSKNRSKKHTEKLTTQFQPKVREMLPKGGQKTTDKGGKGRDPGWNPPRKKKEYCKNQTYCGERVHAGRLHADTSKLNTPLRWAASGPGANIFSISAPILAPFWSIFSDLCIFSSIEFALNFYRFLIDFWYPWSCEKTILTLYLLQKTRNRRFRNSIDLSLILDLGLVPFW